MVHDQPQTGALFRRLCRAANDRSILVLAGCRRRKFLERVPDQKNECQVGGSLRHPCFLRHASSSGSAELRTDYFRVCPRWSCESLPRWGLDSRGAHYSSSAFRTCPNEHVSSWRAGMFKSNSLESQPALVETAPGHSERRGARSRAIRECLGRHSGRAFGKGPAITFACTKLGI